MSFITFNRQQIIGGAICFAIIITFTIAITYDIVKKLIYKMKTNTKKQTEQTNTSTDIIILMYTALFIMLLHQIFITFNFMFSDSQFQCLLITKFCTLLFHLTRCSMYLIFVRRIQVIYCDTMFALSKLHTYILYSVIAVYSIPYIIYINWNNINVTYDSQYGCMIQYESKLYFFIIAALDILIAVYCLYLFIYPLYRLILSQETKAISVKLYQVMIKYSILYLSSIISAFILICVSYIFSVGYNYSMIDSFINGFILIFLHPLHNKFYKKFCCIAHSFCIIVCDAPNNINDAPKDTNCNTNETNQSDGKNKTTDTKTKHVTINMELESKNNNKTIELQKINTHIKPQLNIQIADNTPSVATINTAKNIRQLMAEKARQRLSFGDTTRLSHVNIGTNPTVLPVKSISPPPVSISENPSFSTDVSNEKDSNDAMSHMSYSDKMYEINLECNDSDKTNVNAEGVQTKLGANEDVIDTMRPAVHGEQSTNESSNIVDIIMEELEMDMNDLIKLEAMSSVKSIIEFGNRDKGDSVISLCKKRSNTLKFINYESNKL